MNLANCNYDELIMSYLDGRTTSEEALALLSWIAESESNQAYFDSFKDVWRLTAFDIPQQVEIDAALDSVNAKIDTIEETAGAKIVGMPWVSKNYKYVSGIAAAVVVALFLGFLVRKPFTPSVMMASSQWTEETPYELPDGTKVSFEGEANISHPKQFADAQRAVSFDGKAFFDVAKEETRPFVIHCGGLEVEVLGTTFLLEAGKTSDIYRLDLYTGKVRMTADGREAEAIEVAPGERGVFNTADKSLKLMSYAEVKEDELKTDRVLDFNNVPLPVIVETLEYLFNVEIVLGEGLENERITARFTDEDPVDEVLETIAEVFGRDVESQGEGRYILR